MLLLCLRRCMQRRRPLWVQALAVSSLVLCEPPLHARKHPQLSFLKDFLKVQVYRWMKRERQANKVFLRFALAYNSGGTVFDRLPVTWQQAMLDNFAATLSEID